MLQSSFSIKELKDLAKIPSIRCIIVQEELDRSMNEQSAIEMSDSARESHLHTARLLKKKLQIFTGENFVRVKEAELESLLMNDSDNSKVNVIFRFLMHPVSSKTDPAGTISSIQCAKNKLEGPAYRQKSVEDPSLAYLNLKADLVVTAVGYYSLPLAGIGNFDESSHVLPNSHGCVLEAKHSDKFRVGIYCAGWVKTGAKGIIDTTMKGAEETYNNLKTHLLAGKLEQKDDPQPKLDTLKAALHRRTTTFDDWLKIDKIERDLGEKLGKVRHKLVSNEEILRNLSN